MDKFYEDPGKFLLERDAAIEQRLMGKVSEKQSAAARDAEAWSSFTANYPELADFKADVEAVAANHSQEVRMLASKDQKKAMEYVAFKVKEKFQRYAEVMKPTRVLSNTRVDAPLGSNPVVTPAQNVPESTEGLDMISQMRNMRK
jgi:alkanesulfonate monooxygenase SsuD/methylene tetrahydromethanopterin reductase-like flavin-dependent oxidoreductase (luciferase family)